MRRAFQITLGFAGVLLAIASLFLPTTPASGLMIVEELPLENGTVAVLVCACGEQDAREVPYFLEMYRLRPPGTNELGAFGKKYPEFVERHGKVVASPRRVHPDEEGHLDIAYLTMRERRDPRIVSWRDVVLEVPFSARTWRTVHSDVQCGQMLWPAGTVFLGIRDGKKGG